jgi:hypothetical protein
MTFRIRTGAERLEDKPEIEAAVRQRAGDMGGERVNPEVMQDKGVREESKQVYIRRQRSNRQQRVSAAVFNEQVAQDERVSETDAERTDLNAGMRFGRYQGDRLLRDGGLHPGDLQQQKCENHHTGYTRNHPEDDPDDASGNRSYRMPAHSGFLSKTESSLPLFVPFLTGAF